MHEVVGKRGVSGLFLISNLLLFIYLSELNLLTLLYLILDTDN